MTLNIVAHKLVAVVERVGFANRDIFDVHFFLKEGWPINSLIIQQRTGLSMSDFFKQCIGLLGKVDKKTILAGLGELLTDKQKAWAKSHLVDETIFLLKAKMAIDGL